MGGPRALEGMVEEFEDGLHWAKQAEWFADGLCDQAHALMELSTGLRLPAEDAECFKVDLYGDLTLIEARGVGDGYEGWYYAWQITAIDIAAQHMAKAIQQYTGEITFAKDCRELIVAATFEQVG